MTHGFEGLRFDDGSKDINTRPPTGDATATTEPRPPNDRECKQYDLRKCSSVRGCFVSKTRENDGECWSYSDHPQQPRTDVTGTTRDGTDTRLANDPAPATRDDATEFSKTDPSTTGSRTIDTTRAPLDTANKEGAPVDPTRTNVQDTSTLNTRETTTASTSETSSTRPETTTTTTKPAEETQPSEPAEPV